MNRPKAGRVRQAGVKQRRAASRVCRCGSPISISRRRIQAHPCDVIDGSGNAAQLFDERRDTLHRSSQPFDVEDDIAAGHVSTGRVVEERQDPPDETACLGDDRFGSNSEVALLPRHVRSAPSNGHARRWMVGRGCSNLFVISPIWVSENSYVRTKPSKFWSQRTALQ
jgi:hypothetical protein